MTSSSSRKSSGIGGFSVDDHEKVRNLDCRVAYCDGVQAFRRGFLETSGVVSPMSGARAMK